MNPDLAKNEIVKKIERRNLSHFKASFLSNNNRHIKDIYEQPGFGLTSRKSKIRTPSRDMIMTEGDIEMFGMSFTSNFIRFRSGFQPHCC